MASLPFFSGAAAQSTADHLLKWRQIWTQEKQAERAFEIQERQLLGQETQAQQTYELGRSKLEFAQKDAAANREFYERLQNLQQDHALGLVKRRELYEMSELAIDRMANMTLEQQWDTVEQFEALDSPLHVLMRNIVRQELFTNLDDAAARIDHAISSPPGTQINRPFTEMALEAFISRTGMSGEAADALRENLTTILDQRAEEAEELNALAIEGVRTAVRRAKADVGEVEGRTVLMDAQTQDILHGITVRDEQREAILEGIERQNQILGLQATHLELMNEDLPARLQAELRIMSAQARGLEVDTELAERVMDDKVRLIAGQTALTEEEVRHQLATAASRDALIQSLPDQLQAELRVLDAQAQELESANELFNRVMEYTVRRAAAETGMSEEDLRHQLATASVKDALVQGDLDHVRAVINYTISNTALTDATRDLTREQIAALGLDMAATRIEIASTLAESGQTALLRELLPDLMEGLVDTSVIPRLTDALVEIADSNMSHRNKMEAANARIAIAEAGLMEFREADAPRSAAFDRWIGHTQIAQGWRSLEIDGERLEFDRDRHGDVVRLEEWGLRIRERELDAYIQSLADKRAIDARGPGPLNPLDVHRDIRGATNLSVSTLTQQRSDVDNFDRQLEDLHDFIRVDEETGAAIGVHPQDEMALRGMGTRYGIPDADVMPELELARILDGYLRTERAAAASLAQASTRAYVNAWMAQTGAPPLPQDLGFEGTDPIWRAAFGTVPGASAMPEVFDAVEDTAEYLATKVASQVDPLYGASYGMASQVYAELVDMFGTTILGASGIFDEADVMRYLNREAQEYQNVIQFVGQAVERFKELGIADIDVSLRGGRERLGELLTRQSDAAVSLLRDLDELPDTLGQVGDIFASFAPSGALAGRHDANVRLSRSISSSLGIPHEIMYQEGLIDHTGQIINRGALRNFLNSHLHMIAEQRIALHILERY